MPGNPLPTRSKKYNEPNILDGALAVRKAGGAKLGNHRNASAAAALGREVQTAGADQFAADTLPIIDAIRASGVADLRGLALALNSRGIRTARVGRWRVSSGNLAVWTLKYHMPACRCLACWSVNVTLPLIGLTAHEKRLNRDLKNRFGTKVYAAEELTAELSAAFLCAHLGVEGCPASAPMIQNWRVEEGRISGSS